MDVSLSNSASSNLYTFDTLVTGMPTMQLRLASLAPTSVVFHLIKRILIWLQNVSKWVWDPDYALSSMTMLASQSSLLESGRG